MFLETVLNQFLEIQVFFFANKSSEKMKNAKNGGFHFTKQVFSAKLFLKL